MKTSVIAELYPWQPPTPLTRVLGSKATQIVMKKHKQRRMFILEKKRE